MGQCVEKLPHECGSSDGLQVFEEDGNFDGYCFACGTYVDDPYKDKPKGYVPVFQKKSQEDIARELVEIYGCPVVDVEERGLTKESLDYFGYRIGLSRADGTTPEVLYRPYTKDGGIVSYKVKLLGLKRDPWWVGSGRDVDLFGWHQAIQTGAAKLIVTEGEEDAVAMFQMIKQFNKNTSYADRIPAVISLTHGAASAVKSLSKVATEIRRYFKEVVLAFDMDEVGQKAARDVVEQVLGDAKIANLPEKDANKCLLEGRTKAAVKAVLFLSAVPKNTRIIRGSTLREEANKQPEWGKPWPFEGLTRLTRGRRRGETIYFGAGVKMGKSELVDTIAAQIIVEDDLPCLLVKPEQIPPKTYQRLVGKAAGHIFHDPTIEFDQEAFDKAEPNIGNKALIVGSYQFVDWSVLREDIRYAVVAEGVKDVILDPITTFTNTMSASDANEFLTTMTAELSADAKDRDFTAYLFCHLKAPENGPPHERGGAVLSTQFAGSRAMMRTCNYMIGIQGNKDPDLEIDQRNIRELVVLEDREFGASGKVRLFWDRHTGLFEEI